jgi:hypothetical protein
VPFLPPLPPQGVAVCSVHYLGMEAAVYDPPSRAIADADIPDNAMTLTSYACVFTILFCVGCLWAVVVVNRGANVARGQEVDTLYKKLLLAAGMQIQSSAGGTARSGQGGAASSAAASTIGQGSLRDAEKALAFLSAAAAFTTRYTTKRMNPGMDPDVATIEQNILASLTSLLPPARDRNNTERSLSPKTNDSEDSQRGLLGDAMNDKIERDRSGSLVVGVPPMRWSSSKVYVSEDGGLKGSGSRRDSSHNSSHNPSGGGSSSARMSSEGPPSGRRSTAGSVPQIEEGGGVALV